MTKTKLTIIRYQLPSYWASYLINADASGMSDKDQMEAELFLSKHKLPSASDCVENGFQTYNDANRMGGDVSTYTFLIH